MIEEAEQTEQTCAIAATRFLLSRKHWHNRITTTTTDVSYASYAPSFGPQTSPYPRESADSGLIPAWSLDNEPGKENERGRLRQLLRQSLRKTRSTTTCTCALRPITLVCDCTSSAPPTPPMPSLGFLKKKRTKDTQGAPSDFQSKSPVDAPTSTHPPTTNDPSKPILSNKSAFPPKTDSSVPPTPISAGGAAGGAAPEQTNASQDHSTTGDNVEHATPPVTTDGEQHQPPKQQEEPAASSQHDSAHPSDQSAAEDEKPAATDLSMNKPSSNTVRETKGKYALNDFNFQRTLGTGSFGRVHLVQSKHNQRFYAIKVLKKAQVVKMKQIEHTNDERRMLQRCKHPFLITLWGTWQDSRNLYMVMDFIEGGELFSLLRKSQVCPRFPSIALTSTSCPPPPPPKYAC